MIESLKKFFGFSYDFTPVISIINNLEPEIAKLSDEELKSKTQEFKKALADGEDINDVLPGAFAVAREAARRTLSQRHFDVQLMGGISLHKGWISEMRTGEGKTLTATAPVYLNALTGKGVHVVTVNEYLAKRDAVWMGQVYHFLGLKVACLVNNGAYMYDPGWHIPEGEETLIDKERDASGSFLIQSEYLRPITRREAYLADITYGTNHEFGFDYLRDNLSYGLEAQVQRGHYYAVIDEIDSILIDEARTPLIIAAPDNESSNYYKDFARAANNLIAEEDYLVDEKLKTVSITDAGIEKTEKMLGIGNIYAPENLRLVRYLDESLRAQALFKRDHHYVVKNGEVIIVDEFTGRMMPGRRYSGGLHQAIEAKEGVLVKEESRTYARITIQNYFRLYKKISGMTGTAQTSAEEFHKVYHLEVQTITPNRPSTRKDLPDIVYKNLDAKFKAIAAEVAERHKAGQPVLIGTVSIEKNEMISAYLTRAGIPHEVLNAKNNEHEGAIIAQAGRLGAVTVATNMAGRGVDIILGGNPANPIEAQKVRELGGLCVIGTERHEARRIDNQLRGRAGRQGDPGSTQFFLSLEDDLMRIFGGEKIQGLMQALNIPDDMPIQSKMVSGAIIQAQSKVEGFNFDARKHLLEFDDVLNKQRTAVYEKRQEILGSLNKDDIKKHIVEASLAQTDRIVNEIFAGATPEEEETKLKSLRAFLIDAKILTSPESFDEVLKKIETLQLDEAKEELKKFFEETLEKRGSEIMVDPTLPSKLLGILDMLWLNHLENMDALAESVRLRAYAQKEPIVEYRREGHLLYQELFQNFENWIFSNIFKVASAEGGSSLVAQAIPQSVQSHGGVNVAGSSSEVGRNDPCPCGSGKKYKKCHGA